MNVIFLEKENYPEWDEFCFDSDNAWFWHTTPFMEYTMAMREEVNSENKSFMVKIDGKIVAICPLIIEEKEGLREFSYDGAHSQIPGFGNLTKKLKEKVEKKVYETIDLLAKENNVKKISFKYAPLAKSYGKNPMSNSLNKFGYLDTSWETQIIDLSKSLEELRLGVRHGHDSAINSASKVLEYSIFDKDNMTKEDFEVYRKLHHKAAGRVTRALITFDMMRAWIKNGNAFLVGAKKDGLFVGFAYFVNYKGGVYYMSAANDREIKEISIGHFILWKAIEYMKNKGSAFFDIGYQQYGPTLHVFPSEKEIEISKFKRGFGGFSSILLAGEKFYDRDLFKKEYSKKLENYLRTYGE